MSYAAPLKDMLFVLNELAGLKKINALPNCEDATPDTVEAILEEHAKFAGEVIAPLNWTSDQAPSFWKDGEVTTSKGFKEAFKQFGRACSIRPNSVDKAYRKSSRHHVWKC